MSIFHLLRGRFMNLRFGIFPCVMIIFATVRTLMSGNAVLLTGLCMAFLPFFSQQSNTTCFAVDVSEEKEMLSTYFMDYILMTTGMGYLYILTMIGESFVPGYVVNTMLTETFLLVFLCNLVFINILVPLTYALDSLQRLTVAALLVIVEIAFIQFAMFALRMMGDAFVLTAQPWLYILMVLIPMTAFELIFFRWWQNRKLRDKTEPGHQQNLMEIAIDAHTKKAE